MSNYNKGKIMFKRYTSIHTKKENEFQDRNNVILVMHFSH